MGRICAIVALAAGVLSPQDPPPVTGKYPAIENEPFGQAEMGRIDAMERGLARAADKVLPDVTALLVHGLSDPSRFVRYKAAEFLGAYRDPPDAVPALVQFSIAVEREVDELLMPRLYRFDAKGKPADPALQTLPQELAPATSSCVRMAVFAYAALGRQHDNAAEATLLEKALHREIAKTPAAMVRALGEQLAACDSRRALDAAIRWQQRLEEFLALDDKRRPQPVRLSFAGAPELADGELAKWDDHDAIGDALQHAFARAGIKLSAPPNKARGWSTLLRTHQARFAAEAAVAERAAGDKGGE